MTGNVIARAPLNRRLFALFSALTLLTVVSAAFTHTTFSASSPTGGAPAGSTPTAHPGFPAPLNGTQVRSSSVALGDLNNDGVADIVVGGADGKVHAFRGNGTQLWTFDTGNMAIEGKAAIGDIDKDGQNEVVIGAGSTFTPSSHGGLYVLDHSGNLRCSFQTADFNRDGWRDGVFSSPALADIDQNDGGKLEIVFGGFDGYVRMINHDCTPVWQKFVRDTVWSSPAIGDIDRDGRPDIVIGVDSHAEPAFGTGDGGILHVYKADGSEVSGFPIQIDEVIYSSPGLADINGDGWLDIVVGTGECWTVAACAPNGNVHPGVGHYLNAWDHTGHYLPGWPKPLGNTFAFASPALADIDGDGLPEVIVNTDDGFVHALNANATEVSGWPRLVTTPAGPGSVVHYATRASPIVADITGDGQPEIILPSNWELVVWDRNGNQLTRSSYPPPAGVWDLSTNYPVNGGAAVGDIDGNGDLELVVGGAYNSSGSPGALYAWDVSATTSAPLPWPTFRRDPRNNAILVSPALRPSTQDITLMLEQNSSRSITVAIDDAAGGQLSWTATDNQAWIQLSPSSGSTPDTLRITVNSSSALDRQDGVVTLVSSVGNKTINVHMLVADTVYDVDMPLIQR